MRKQIALMATVAALAITPALAQTTAPNQDTKPAPQAQPSMPPASSGQSTTAPSSDAAKSTTAPAAGKFVNTQTSDQWLASDLMGMKVMGNGDESIGSIDDLLVDKSGRVMAAVIGVGGFLGIGAKDVAISFDALQITQDKNGNPQARLSLTKKEIEGAPDFKSLADAKSESNRQTPPAGGSSTPRKN